MRVKTKSKILLIGGYRKARTLSKSLLEKGYKVTVINDNYEQCLNLSEIPGLKVYNGDGTLPSVLSNAGAQGCRIAIALTSKDEDNLVACQLCKTRFGVKRTISLVETPNKSEFFRKMGVDSAICAMDKISSILEQQAAVEKISDSITLGEGRVSINEIKIESEYPVVGKMLKDISLPKDTNIGCILRGDDTIIPRGDTSIFAGDTLLLIAEVGGEEKTIKIITGAV